MACFGCCWKPSKRNEDKPLIIDVEQALGEEAWQAFIHCYGKCRRKFINRKNFKIEVPMNYYHFERHGDQMFKTKKRPNNALSSGAEPQPSKSLLKGKQLAYRDQTSPEHIGLETVFNNDTDQDQTYNFKFDKTRRATINISYQKGYSIGGSANFNLGLPKVLSDSSLGVSTNMNIQVTKTTGETFEESITTSANSEIKVSANSRYTVSVVLEERSLLADFQMDMVMSMPAKRAPVYIKDKRSGDLVFVFTCNNLLEVFEKHPDVSKVKDAEGKVRPDAVMFHIEGIVDGMQLSSHLINLTGHACKDDKHSSPARPDGGEGGEGDGM